MTLQRCEQLRVLLVGGYPPPFGGIATHLVSLIPGLIDRGAEDVAVVNFSHSVDQVEKIPGAIVYRYNIKKHLHLLLNPLYWSLISKVIREMRPTGMSYRDVLREALKSILIHRVAEKHQSQVVNFYESNAHFELVPLARHWGNRRGIGLTVFGEVYSDLEFMRDRLLLVNQLMTLPTEVWASSDHCGNSFKILGIERPVKTVYFGVDLVADDHITLRDAFRQKYAIKEEDVVALFMGRFVKDMGFDVLLQIIPDMLVENKRLKFILAGAAGELSNDAAALAHQYPEQVIIFQNFPFSLQQSLYSAADIVVAPSFCRRACMGLSIKEAMAAKLPVVATDSGGIAEAVVHGETGFLVPLNIKTQGADQLKLKHYLSELINDKDKRLNFGLAGRQRAEEIFSVEATLNRVAEIFMSIREKMNQSTVGV